MNLKCCYACDKKLVCKYYDYDDPRSFAGECRLYYEKKKPVDTQPKRQEIKTKNLEPKLEVASVAEKNQVYVGRKMYRVYNHPCSGWVARITTVREPTIEEIKTDLGVKVFFTLDEAQSKARELNHNK